MEHTGDQFPYKCSKCMKLFKFPFQLKRHERIHNGYSCDICNITLEKWTQLVKHKSREHSDKKQVPVKCEECQKVFRSKANLNKHSLIHKEDRITFHCPMEMCARWFYFKNNLTQHLKSFHEGKKYLCSHENCSAKFFSKQRLKNHVDRCHGSNPQPDSVPKKRKKPSQPRKDKGTVKKPMASLLAGVDCSSGANLLLQDEKRPLDSMEKISEEVGQLFEETSETYSETETFVGCGRAGNAKTIEDLDGDFQIPGIIHGALKRMEEGKHFMKRKIDNFYDSDTDTETQPVTGSETSEKPVFNFTKFLKK